MKTQIAGLIVTVAMVCSSPAFAQQPGSNSEASEALKSYKWDVGGSLGIIGIGGREFVEPGPAGYNSEGGFIWNIDAGRYFTSHLKAEAGLMKANSRSFSDSREQFEYTTREVHPTSVSGALTYQFFENVFAHPFVSAGIRVTSLYEESQRYVYTPDYQKSTVSTSSRRFTETRPFVAVGYKSYFNERVYMRTEFLLAFDTRGISHGTLRAGAGIDF